MAQIIEIDHDATQSIQPRSRLPALSFSTARRRFQMGSCTRGVDEAVIDVGQQQPNSVNRRDDAAPQCVLCTGKREGRRVRGNGSGRDGQLEDGPVLRPRGCACLCGMHIV